MRVWAALSQKGGSGKSTLVLHLAVAAIADNRVTSVIDLDPQKSAEKWAALREQKTKLEEPIIVHGLPMQLRSMLDRARDTDHDLVLVDTPPAIDKITIFTASASDLIIVPTRTGILDEQALDETLQVLRETHAIHKVVVVINAAGSDLKAKDSIKKLARKVHKVPVLSTELEERLDFRKSLGAGKGVTEAAARSDAAKELMKLYEALSKWDAQLTKVRKKVAA